MSEPLIEELIASSLDQSPELHVHMLAQACIRRDQRIVELERLLDGALLVPEPTSEEWKAIAANARSADLVDFLSGAAAYGLWLRGKIPQSIPANRVLGKMEAGVDVREWNAMQSVIAAAEYFLAQDPYASTATAIMQKRSDLFLAVKSLKDLRSAKAGT